MTDLLQPEDDLRQYAPATQRNREPILAVLQRVLPPRGTVLEIASGTGEHAVFFAPHLEQLFWQPSDPNPLARDSIAAWRGFCSASNLGEPLALNVQRSPWPVETEAGGLSQAITAIVCINMIHIAPWESCLGLLAGAERILPAGGVLYLYGPYKRSGQHTASSNASFDLMLRTENPTWGVRDLEEVVAVALSHQLQLQEVIEMPANNLSVVFHRA